MAEEKQHQALYRRYRPQTPDEVLGQDHVVRALTGAIREDRLHHAFLFCGPRGTGKTSTARILAKMVNCEQGPTAEPCGVCEQCVAIREGQHLDVVEIDAASHGGVEDARELRERAPTAPAMGREKVYIIDEAQRLSREAFDALLKVFEEPPPGVRFVLATTEPHKMPATIVGRCQRFDFRRITMEQLAEHLQTIAAAEGVTLTRLGRRRHRPAGPRAPPATRSRSWTRPSVLGGAPGRRRRDRRRSSAPRAPRSSTSSPTPSRSATPAPRSRSSTAWCRTARTCATSPPRPSPTSATCCWSRPRPARTTSSTSRPTGTSTSASRPTKFTPAELARVIALLLAAQNDMRWTTSPRLSLELALVRATIPETDPNPAGLVARLERLERLANLDVASATGVVPAGGTSDTATIPDLAPSELRSSGSPLTAAPPTVDRSRGGRPSPLRREGLAPSAATRGAEPRSRSERAPTPPPTREPRPPPPRPDGVQTQVHAADAGTSTWRCSAGRGRR